MKNLILVACVIGLTYAFYMFSGKNGGTPQTPRAAYMGIRTETPLGEYTKYFERKEFISEDEHGRRIMIYHMRAPQKPWPNGVKFPMVLFLHGGTGLVYGAPHLLGGDNALKYPAFVVAPSIPLNMIWAVPDKRDDVTEELRAFSAGKENGIHHAARLVRHLAAEYPIDTRRIYAIGCSEGGAGVYGAALHYPDMFAAGVVLSGGWHVSDAHRMTKTPILAIHGTRDTVAPYDRARRIAVAIKRNGGEIGFVSLNMGHNCPSPALYSDRVWNWMFSKSGTP